MRPIFLVLTAIILSFSSCSTKQGEFSEAQRLEEIASRVTIVRDSFGVPHIYGESDADAIFGMLYAQCEDDFNRVEQNYIWATGRLAEVEGESAIYSDLRANMFMTQDEAEQMYENSPEEVKKWCQAFADGVNYYIMTHPEVKPRLLTKFEPWMPLYFSEGSIGGDIERVSTRKIKAFYEEDTDQDLAFASLDDRLVQFEEPQGSNGIALDGSMTESGNAMLLINPHTSFYFRGELQMKSNENLNAYGAVTWGQFFIYQGFNEHTGWMHTSTYTDVIDEFQEEIITKNDELYYKYGEELRAVTSLEVPLNYKTDEGVQEKTFTVYRTHHGPITHKDGDKWVATAMMWDPVNALKQSFERTIQSDYKGFRQMMDIKTNSSNNTVYADSDGNIAYFHGNFIPKRDVKFDYAKPVDGSDPATDWNGLHDVEDHIKLLNPSVGWLQNCNSTPFTAADIDSPKAEDYPYYMSTAPENFRGIHAIDLLKNTEKLSLDGLIDLAYDNRLPAFEVLIPGLIKAFDANPNRAYAKEINHLRNWDYRTTEKSVAMTLAHFYATAYMRYGDRPKGLSFMELFSHWAEDSSLEERRSIFYKTVDELRDSFGNAALEWGEVNRFQRIDGAIRQAFSDSLPSTPIGLASGRWGALAAYGARYHNNTKKIYGTRGNSFVAVVEFGERLKAKSLLAGGQSGDPENTHFDDQIESYRNANFKEVSFYDEDVMKAAERIYHPGDDQ